MAWRILRRSSSACSWIHFQFILSCRYWFFTKRELSPTTRIDVIVCDEKNPNREQWDRRVTIFSGESAHDWSLLFTDTGMDKCIEVEWALLQSIATLRHRRVVCCQWWMDVFQIDQTVEWILIQNKNENRLVCNLFTCVTMKVFLCIYQNLVHPVECPLYYIYLFSVRVNRKGLRKTNLKALYKGLSSHKIVFPLFVDHLMLIFHILVIYFLNFLFQNASCSARRKWRWSSKDRAAGASAQIAASGGWSK